MSRVGFFLGSILLAVGLGNQDGATAGLGAGILALSVTDIIFRKGDPRG